MRSKLNPALVGVLALVALVAVGCGGASDDAANTGTASADAGASHQITIGLDVPNDADLLLPTQAAQDLGYFGDEGLRVKVVSFQGGADLVKAMVGGSVQIGVATGIDAVAAAAKGVPMRVVSGIGATNPSHLMVPPDSSIHDIAKLSPDTGFGIARFGGVTDFVARLTAERAGIPKDQVKEVAIGPDGLMAAVEAGGKDIGVFQWVPNSALTFEANGKLRTVAKVADVFPEDQYSAVIVQPKFIESDRETVTKTLTALYRAIGKIKSDRAYGEKLLVDRLKVDQANVSKVYDETVPRWSNTGKVSTAGLETYAKHLPQLKVAPKSPSLNEFYTDEFLPVKAG